ncbi:thiol peroxidase [Lactobacillus sp. ESL0703]|uniref:thiol peroxidase n=1 Tax=Lactobacillus sp. ESL0703 TaxID=2983218 RepID=UPI0023F808E6|nr:thiol peroxidase [Lactobacillus sp. ESL0703]MDF7668279.1 thiol peroxidase [Lactobacillus sp. ESL0703]
MKITRLNEPLYTNGEPPKVGDKLPDFTVVRADGSKATKADLLSKPTLISVVPDLNTSVCSISTKRFNNEVDKFDGINFYTISTNTLDDQKNWCAAEGVKNMEILSDESHNFGEEMGLYLESGVDSRSVWIISADGEVLYQELVYEMTDEPDYDAALTFLSNLK